MTLAASSEPVPHPADPNAGSDGVPSTQTGPRGARTVPGYGLARPTVDQVRQSLQRTLPRDYEPVWSQLLAETGIRGTERDRDSLERLLTVMTESVHVIAALTARSQAIRLASFDQLSALHPCAEDASTHDTDPARQPSPAADSA